ncbi:beta strand repeat-containing protein [Arthrobacter bambusae]|uniref:beta strand repeat-containing protein n=1 Tax=Arthrobacter bambusae TaxID=1338426 RepID=UPI0027868918|nr:isopeptide-forming domain-containing fimbrial protein [Arthrobacter bambusae]MDQ0031677.1 fimbrial isopeptide formation D2 family protein/uncharacterized repeat protein (TIGR01451 family) [Arthrobacter bambusae]MDQ0098782.1 fimbrial isopeptide formation D2 family protein/uncharacterized repeat protein (TIGR01451 family) [Arthrobacter bambusae]
MGTESNELRGRRGHRRTGIKSLLRRFIAPARGLRVLAGVLATALVASILGLGAAIPAKAASVAVHEIAANWVGNPTTAPFGSAVMSEWHISTNDATNPQANNPVNNVRVTLTATNGVFASIPAACKTSGVTPVSSISANGSTLVCNIGTVKEGTASVIQAPVRATGPVGSKVSVSGTATSDSATAPTAPATTPGLPITGGHGMDLVISAASDQQITMASRSGGNRQTIAVDYGIAMTAGSIPGPSTYTFSVDIAVSPANQLPGLQWEGCTPVDNSGTALGIPYSASTFADRTNAPTCTISGSGTHYTITVSGLDYSMQHVPAKDSLGNAIPSTTEFIASGKLSFSYTAPVTQNTGVTFTGTPTPFTFVDGVTQPETNASNDVSSTTLIVPGIFSDSWQGGPTVGRSPWDANLFAAPGSAQNKTLPWPAAGTSTNPGPYSINDQPLASLADSVAWSWSGYTGPGGADLAGSCSMVQNPTAFTARYVDVLAADGGANYSKMTTAHVWYRTDALNTKTETCGEPVGVAGSPWIAAPFPAGCASLTALVSPAYSDDQCLITLPAGVTAVKMTWNPAVDKQVHHFLRVWGYVPPTAPIGAESWTVGAFNMPSDPALVFGPTWPKLNNYINVSTSPAVTAVIPGSVYGPNTNGFRDAMRIQGPTGVITKSTPSTTAQPGAPVTYNLTAEADLAVQSPPNQTFTVTDTLPAGMSYVAGSGTPTPVISTNSSGLQILSYTFTNVTANTPQPITYQAQIPANSSVAPGTVLTNTAQVDVPGDNRPVSARQATANVTVPNNGATNLGKSVEANTLSFYGDSSAWDLVVNSQDPVNNPYTDTIDILPSKADGRGTTIDGAYTVTGVTAVAGATVYYSTAAAGSLNNDPRDPSNGGTPGSITGNTAGWTTVKPANPTAVRIIGPALAPGASQNIRIAFTTPAGTSCTAPAATDNKPGQILVNSANSIAGHTALPMLSSATTTIGNCYALDLKKYVLVKGGNPNPSDPATNPSWLDANTVAQYPQYAAGDTVPFEVIATNKGTGTLSNITVSDPKAPACGGTIASLAPAATQVFNCQLTAGVGTTVNTASASVTPPTGPALTTSDPAGFVVPAPYTVTKTSDAGAMVTTGTVVHYTVTVTEPATSAAPSLNPSISDDLSSVLDDATYNNDAAASAGGTPTVTGNTLTWSAASIMPGQTITINYSMTVNTPDTGDKVLKNTVVTPPGASNCPTGSTDSACTVTVPVQVPGIALVKSVAETALSVGETLHYSLVVTNTGNVTLANVSAAETAFTGSGTAPALTCPAGAASLAPGAQVTCAATYVVTQADVDAGKINNTATATGTPPAGPAVTSPPSSAAVPATQTPGQSFTKTADASAVGSPAKAGDVITYHFSSTNTGNVTLTNVGITDNLAGLSALVYTWPGTAGTLLPGQSVTATATYHLTQADIDAGHVANTALASGTDPGGKSTNTPPSNTDTPLPPAPGQSFTKTADASAVGSPAKVGDVITYHFSSTNTGNVTLTNVGITDNLAGLSALVYTWPGTAGTLLPGQSVTATATYHLTQADIDAGHVANTALASGTDPGGKTTNTPPSNTDTPLPPAPGQSFTKTADASAVGSPAKAGNVITYHFSSTNTGNVTLTNVGITDNLAGLSALVYTWPGTAGTLLPGQSVTATATYQVTQADIDAGHVANTALASGTDPGGKSTNTPPSNTDTPFMKVPPGPVTEPPATAPLAADPSPSGPVDLAYTGAWLLGLPLGLVLLLGGTFFLVASKRRRSRH